MLFTDNKWFDPFGNLGNYKVLNTHVLFAYLFVAFEILIDFQKFDS